ncbi:MAG TPA: hypothetical protein VII11_02270 [Bacteroidota bacterium]
MGNSKAIMLGAISLIIGMYAVKIKQADQSVAQIGNSRGSELQALELAKTGVDLAVNELSATQNGISWRSRQKSILGGSVNYTIDNIAFGKEKVTVTATYNGQSRTVIAELEKSHGGQQQISRRKKKNWSRWEVSKLYVKPNKKNWHSEGHGPI